MSGAEIAAWSFLVCAWICPIGVVAVAVVATWVQVAREHRRAG